MQLLPQVCDSNKERSAVKTVNNENHLWEQVFSVIQNSFSINKHLDFFKWMQSSVVEVLPHDILVAAWGDFETGDLNFDVSSNIVFYPT